MAMVQLGKQRDATLRRIDADTQRLRAGVASGRLSQALVDALGRGAGGRSLADRRALGRHLDQSAVEDRLLLERHGVDQAWELAAAALATTDLSEVAPDRREELVRGTEAVAADRTTRWPLRVAAVQLTAALAGVAGASDEAAGTLRRMAQDASEDPWVQAAALEGWLTLCHPQEARAMLDVVLFRPDDLEGIVHPDHLFARGRAALLAGSTARWDLLVRLLDSGEPSEHVRMCAIRGLAQSTEPDHVRRVAQHLTQAPQDDRVAAAGWVTLLDGDRPMAWEAVARAVAQSPSARAVGVVFEDLWVRVRDGDLAPVQGRVPSEAWSAAFAVWAEGADDDVARQARVWQVWSALQADALTQQAWSEVVRAVRTTPEGSTVVFDSGAVAGLSGSQLLDVLFTLAHDDVDLTAQPRGRCDDVRGRSPKGWNVHVGLGVTRAAWRMKHEVTHPRHDKRQAYHHTTDHVPVGSLIAWSGRMSEVTSTEVPGRRISTPTTMAWGEHLPLPATLLASARHGAVHLAVPDGQIAVRRTSWRARWRVARRYAKLADLRERLVALPRDEAIRTYDAELGKQGFSVERTSRQVAGPLALGGSLDWLGASGSGDVAATAELAVLSAGALGIWSATKVAREVQVRRWRKQVPLVVGGWGSRGKSSVERLKGGLFHGLGYTVLCKSTGCEAMLLLGYPGADAAEVFLFRPRDKATIVEQANVLRIAATLKPQVLLWECMALNPIYTGILQRAWMRDDITTVTNTYPDHEDIQGPSGRDVADTIACITPEHGRLITSEQHMTPVLERRARQLRSQFAACRPRDWVLIPRDVLARFPYAAYDRNVSLVTRVATSLGIAPDVAWRTMADHVLTDLGAFKRYGPIDVDGRQLTFVNGCSANDRASFMSNWERADLSSFDDDAGLGTSLTAVLNNRADRLARQAVFARITAMDVAADRVVIIGTNVRPMRDAITASLAEDLAPRLQEIAHGSGGRDKLRAIFQARLRRRPLSEARAKEVVAGFLAALPEDLPPEERARVEAARTAWEEEVAWLRELSSGDFDVTGAITRFTSFLARRVVPFPESGLKGDQVLHRLALTLPTGVKGVVLGCENIKGTGLDFVYRWVSIDRVLGWLDALSRALEARDVEPARELLGRLTAYEGWGLFDARLAQGQLTAWHAAGDFARLTVEDDAEAALGALERVVTARTHKLAEQADAGSSRWDELRKALKGFDILGSYRRRRAADRLYVDLANLRVGTARAAVEADKLVAGEKG